MLNRLFAVVAVACAVLIAPSARAANIAYFNSAAFVDSLEEGENLRHVLADSLHHTVTPFGGTDLNSWANAMATADVLVIAELESANLFAALPAETRADIYGFVRSGRGLVIAGESAGNANTLLNGVFGFTTSAPFDLNSPAPLDPAAAAGTVFATGPAALPGSNLVEATSKATLPVGAKAIYAKGDSASVFVDDIAAAGRVAYLGFDWFEANPTPAAWDQAMGEAVTYVNHPLLTSRRVVLFMNDAFVDSSTAAEDGGEPHKVENLLLEEGHTVTELHGLQAAQWSAALATADVFVIPELENGDLFAALPSATQSVLAAYVLGGGGLITFANGGEDITLLNGVFGYSLVSGSPAANSNLNTGAAAGTAFASGPSILVAANATNGVTTASLPANALALYTETAVTSVFAIKQGFGRIVELGYDFFTNAGTSRSAPAPQAWAATLAEAVTFVSNATGPTPVASAVSEGTDGHVSVDLTGFVGLTGATLSFRAGGDPAFTSLPMTGGTAAQATIPGASVTRKGVQYFLNLTAGAISGTFPRLAPTAGQFLNFPVNISGFQFTSLPAGGFQLGGVPMQAQDANPTAVFDELGAYNIKHWRYGTFDGTNYHEPGGGAVNATPGQGFWILAKNATNIAASGTATNLSGPITLNLAQGFNQIADPFDFPVDFAACVREVGVESNLIGFNGSGYVVGVTVLQPGQGYWIKNDGPGAKTITIPPLGSGVAAAPQPPVNFAEGADWCVRVDAFAGAFTDCGNLVGVRAGAAEGRDDFDLSEPPVPMAGWVAVSSATTTDGALLADWRPAGTGGETWQLTFASDQAGQPFRIDLASQGHLPAGFGIAAFEGEREVDLGAANAIRGVVGSTTSPRVFTVAVGSADYLALQRAETRTRVSAFALAAPFPNPTNAGATIDLAIPAPVADALVQVFDVQGRLVSTLVRGALDQGIHRLAWDGRDQGGARTANGVYFLKAHAGTFTATRKLVRLQ